MYFILICFYFSYVLAKLSLSYPKKKNNDKKISKRKSFQHICVLKQHKYVYLKINIQVKIKQMYFSTKSRQV